MSHIEEVANRLKGLRDALGPTIAEMASACSVDEELYKKFESAEADIPVRTMGMLTENDFLHFFYLFRIF